MAGHLAMRQVPGGRVSDAAAPRGRVEGEGMAGWSQGWVGSILLCMLFDCACASACACAVCVCVCVSPGTSDPPDFGYKDARTRLCICNLSAVNEYVRPPSSCRFCLARAGSLGWLRMLPCWVRGRLLREAGLAWHQAALPGLAAAAAWLKHVSAHGPASFHLLKNIFLFSLVGFNRNLSLLEILVVFPGVLTKWKLVGFRSAPLQVMCGLWALQVFEGGRP